MLMLRRSKRLKLKRKEEEQCTDPFELLPEHVHESIYQHLSGEDILHASEVSPAWYQLMGTSRLCIQKIILRIVPIYNENRTKEMPEILKSQRHYANIYFVSYYETKDKQYYLIVPKYAASLVQLTVNDVYLCDAFSTSALLNLPQLRLLSIERTELAVAGYFLKSTMKNLKHLKIDVALLEDFACFLKNNIQLEEICVLAPQLVTSLAKHGRHLKLKILDVDRYNLMDLTIFLRSQVNTLEDLRTTRLNAEVINMVYNEMQKLAAFKCLSYKETHEEVIIRPNIHIKTLVTGVPNWATLGVNSFENLVLYAPNLVTLRTYYITRPMFRRIVTACQKLTKLTYRDKQSLNCYYTQLKRDLPNANRNIELVRM